MPQNCHALRSVWDTFLETLVFFSLKKKVIQTLGLKEISSAWSVHLHHISDSSMKSLLNLRQRNTMCVPAFILDFIQVITAQLPHVKKIGQPIR